MRSVNNGTTADGTIECGNTVFHASGGMARRIVIEEKIREKAAIIGKHIRVHVPINNKDWLLSIIV